MTVTSWKTGYSLNSVCLNLTQESAHPDETRVIHEKSKNTPQMSNPPPNLAS